MKPTPSALALILASLYASAALAADPQRAAAGATHAPPAAAGDEPVVLDAVVVSATLDLARNGLSPDTGSSQYVIDRAAIAQLPLGAATPLNQVLLRAPGVVRGAFGAVHVRGDHANLQYRINGVMLPESSGGFGQTLDVRAIRSLQLLDGALPAQYGERTAAVVDITTRDGRELGNGGGVGVTGGSHRNFNPHASSWGSWERGSWFVTANYLVNDAGIENPTGSRDAIHDRTHQLKAFGNLAWLVNDETRVGLLFGVANNRFEIPNDPSQETRFDYLARTKFDPAALDERQTEQTRFGTLSLQGQAGSIDYQVSLGQRYSHVRFQPDPVGDLMFDGVASAVRQTDRATTLQADFAQPLGDYNTVRYGLYGLHDRAATRGDVLVFPADAQGAQTTTVPFAIATGGTVRADTLAVYLQDEWRLAVGWTINVGVRGDRYRAFGATESQLSPRVGVVWQVVPATTLHAGYARYFTPPATQRISDQDIARFAGTTNAVRNYGDNKPRVERSHYYDVGVSQQLGDHLTVGLDTYYREVADLQDEGQFGTALIYSTFNFESGRVRGVEFTSSYRNGPWDAYFNLATSRALGKRVVTSQYNFDPDDLAYIADNWVHLDHDQRLAASGGLSYTTDSGARIAADYLFGSGMRKDGKVPNGAALPAWFQMNLSLSREFALADYGALRAHAAVINVLDRRYELRDGTGIGVGAPRFGPRRGFYIGIEMDL